MNKAVSRRLREFNRHYNLADKVMQRDIDATKFKALYSVLKGESKQHWRYEDRIKGAKSLLESFNSKEQIYATTVIDDAEQFMRTNRQSRGKDLDASSPRKPGFFEKTRKAAAGIAAGLMLYSSPAYAQCQQTRNVNEGHTISRLEVTVGNTFKRMGEGQETIVPYDQDLKIRPQTTKRTRPTNETVSVQTKLKVQRLVNGRYSDITDAKGNALTFIDTINPEDLGIAEGERARAIVYYQDLCDMLESTRIYFVQGPRPTLAANTQAAANTAAPPAAVPVKIEGKAVYLMGSEDTDLGEKEKSAPIKGILAQGIVRGRNAMGWATYLGTKQDVEFIGSGGAQISRSFRQTNVGIAGRFAGILMADVEGIWTSAGWGSDRTPLYREIMDNATHQGIYGSAGIILGLPGGFQSPLYAQISIGAGKSTQSLKYTDGLYRTFTIDSLGFNEVFLKGTLNSKFLRLTGSIGQFESNQEIDDDSVLKGNRYNFTADLSVPVTRNRNGSNVYITGQLITSTTKYDGIRAEVPKFGVNAIGVGISIK